MDRSFCCGNNAGSLTNLGDPFTSASKNIFIGSNTKGINNSDKQVVIGANSIGHGSNTTTLGDSNITSIYCNVTSLTNVSDERDKTNVIELSNNDNSIGLNILNRIEPIKFIWNPRDSNANRGKTSIGFYAQNLLNTFNESSLSEYLQNIVDSSNPEKLMINQSDLLPILVKSVNELHVRTSYLEKKLYDLHGIIID